MNMLNALFFPEAVPKEDLFGRLSLLLDRIVYYQVAEEGAVDRGTPWEGYVPVPMGDDRDRFLRLIEDIKRHGAEFYSGQLSSLSGALSDSYDDTTVSSLVASLQGKRGVGEVAEARAKTARLWQARLFLKLAEILAVEEVEIDRSLAAIGTKEKNLFGAIHGDLAEPEDDDLQETAGVSLCGKLPVNSERLLDAWGNLFAEDPREYDVLVTDNDDAAATVFDIFEKQAGKTPRFLAETTMPGCGHRRFRDESVEVMRALTNSRQVIVGCLREVLAGENIDAASRRLASGTEMWSKTMAVLADNRHEGQSVLAFYWLAGCSLKDVFRKICGMSPADPAGEQHGGLIAVLRDEG